MFSEKNRNPLIVVLGPTASGKTALGVEIAKLYNGEVISADSMQIYEGMDISTAKPTDEEKQGIPHHLMGFLPRGNSFSVADYVALAKEKAMEILSRGKLPILVGGTGLYISSLVDNISFDEIKSDGSVRERLLEESKQLGNAEMLRRLSEVDRETADTLHENNIFRIIRALEVYELTGMKLSEHKVNSRRNKSEFDTLMIGLTYSDRQKLYDKINLRVDIMMENGLLEESQTIYSRDKMLTANQAIGYKEFVPYFEGSADLSTCIDKIKQETRRYAKRQLTWFRRDDRIRWVEVDKYNNFENILEIASNLIAKHFNM